jgi:hypothetical protein
MNGNNHAMDEDEVDDFLYGSDASESKYGTTSKSASKKSKTISLSPIFFKNTH